MISSARNSFLQNLLKIRGDSLHLRCISRSNEVNNSDYLNKNDSPEEGRIKTKKISRPLPSIQYSTAAIPKDKRREFMSYFPDIVRDLKGLAEKYDSTSSGVHLARVLQYNVPGGKKTRGITTVQAYEQIAPKEALTEANIKLAIYLGWCNEILQAMFILIDDIMDGSITRRGQPCWHKLEDVQMAAINDGLWIEASIYQILKQHFSHLDSYVKLLELFHEMTFITILGQHLDTKSARDDVMSFTMERYKSIARNKTSYYTFYLPVASAMCLAGYTDPEAFRQAKTILLEMGQFFQIQDDYLDCFGDPDVTGKIGTDIEDGKCSWLAVVCLQRANAAQKKIMQEHYGKSNKESIQRIKQLYEELSIPNTYAIYEEDSYKMLTTHIQQTSRGIPVEVYLRLLEKIYRRKA